MKREITRSLAITAVALLTASAATAQRGRGAAAAVAHDSQDISGYWELSFDSRHVPPPALAATVTPAFRAAKRKQDDEKDREHERDKICSEIICFDRSD